MGDLSERLQKFMARCGVASRRASEDIIRAGRVRVNDQLVQRPGLLVDPRRDRITVDGQPIFPETTLHYIALNKPQGYITTTQDTHGRPTVMGLLPALSARLYPVGRLDEDTTGLLFLTNDGDWAHRITHPRFEVPKHYVAAVQGVVSPQTLARLRRGVPLKDGVTAPAVVRMLHQRPDRSEVELTIIEGRNRQVRRMLAHVGHPVLRLRRIGIGQVRLSSLEVGQSRPLTPDEIASFTDASKER